MATERTGNFGGFEFDPEVFGQMMTEVDYFRTPVIASGIIQQDQSIMDLIGQKGNVATIPIYKPLNMYDDGMAALNNDGTTDNTPVEVSGDKQTCIQSVYIAERQAGAAPEDDYERHIGEPIWSKF